MVCVEHGDDVVRSLVYIVWCDSRGGCEFGEVCRCVEMGFVSVGVSELVEVD